ncbi:hypothetical protein [Deinococcus sp.]|uniref:hypothetical protein n=1 Tax=Deinococcus sp. TaxID=47478 RepID=UPI003CC639C4
MNRLILAAGLLLCACAPALQRSTPAAFQASFSPAGVIWLDGGQVTLARYPAFQQTGVKLPAPAAAVAWQPGSDGSSMPWAALTSAGLLLSADGRPVSVAVGRVVALSSTRVYREDGSATGYDGSLAAGLLGAPDAVVTGGDGLDYALQGSKLYRLDSGGPTLLTSAALPVLYATPGNGEYGGVGTANAPTVTTATGRYTLTGSALERRDAAGVLLASVPHGAGLVGTVGTLIVTVEPGGRLKVFGPDLRALGP